MKKIKFLFCILLSVFILSGCNIEEALMPEEKLNSEGLNQSEELITETLKITLTNNCLWYTCDYDPTTFKVLRCGDVYNFQQAKGASVIMKVEYIKEDRTITGWVTLYLHEDNIIGNKGFPKGYMSMYRDSMYFDNDPEWRDSNIVHPERINTALQNFWNS